MTQNPTANPAPTKAAVDFWAYLADLNRMRADARGGKAANGPDALRMELLLRCVPQEERLRLLAHHGYSVSAWEKWCRNPRNVPAPLQADVLLYWRQRSGHIIEPHEVWVKAA